MSEYSKWSATEMIVRNGGKIGGNGTINIKQPGIGVLGAIDYLVKVHSYRWVRE